MSDLKFVIIGHKNFYEYVTFYIKKFRKFKNHLLFLFDSYPGDEVINFLNKKKINFFYNDVNIGKLNTLIKYSDEYKSRFIKIIDYDDSIYRPGIKKILKEIKLVDDDTFTYHTASKLFSTDKYYGLQTNNTLITSRQNKMSKDVNWSIIPNASAIYSAKIFGLLKNIELDFQKFHNDNLLSITNEMICTKKKKIDQKFYLQFHAFGQTNKSEIERLEQWIVLIKNINNIKKYLIMSSSYKKELNKFMSINDMVRNIYVWINKHLSETDLPNYERIFKFEIESLIEISKLFNNEITDVMNALEKICLENPKLFRNYFSFQKNDSINYDENLEIIDYLNKIKSNFNKNVDTGEVKNGE